MRCQHAGIHGKGSGQSHNRHLFFSSPSFERPSGIWPETKRHSSFTSMDFGSKFAAVLAFILRGGGAG